MTELREIDPASIDQQAFAEHPGVALEAVSPAGERLGLVGARVVGSVASIHGGWTVGSLEVLKPLVEELIHRLRDRYAIRELRAVAKTAELEEFYRSRFSMRLWHEVVIYGRPVGQGRHARRSSAELRPFAPADTEQLLGLAANMDTADLVRLGQQRNARFMVAELDSRVVGYAFSYVEGQVCQFKSLLVAPDQRGRHIGWDLTCDALEWFDRLGLPSQLRTQADNKPARTLYERVGYRLLGQTRMLHLRFD